MNHPPLPDETPIEWSRRVLEAYGETFPTVAELTVERQQPISSPPEPSTSPTDRTLEVLVDTLKSLQPRRKR
jgi:hypothetical protein